MVRVVEGDHGLLAGVVAGDLDGVLDRFSSRVEQGTALGVIAGRQAVESLGHLDIRVVGRDREAGVRELGDLGLHGLDDPRRCVADAGHGDAGTEVDQRVAVDVDEHAAAGSGSEDGDGGSDAGRDSLRLALHASARLGAGNGGDETALLREARSAGQCGGCGVDDGHGHSSARVRRDRIATALCGQC